MLTTLKILKFFFPKDIKKLAAIIFFLSILGIFFSTATFFLTNRVNNLNFRYQRKIQLLDRFIEKNDLINAIYEMGKLPTTSLLQQGYQTLRAVKGEQMCTPKILSTVSSLEDYAHQVKDSSDTINNKNSELHFMEQRINMFEKQQAILYWIQTILQLVTAIYGLYLTVITVRYENISD